MNVPVLTLALASSRRLAAVEAMLHGLACIAIGVAGLSPWQTGLLLPAVVLSLLLGWRRKDSVILGCRNDGQLAIKDGDEWVTVELRPDSLVIPWLVVVRFRRPGEARVRTLAILSDCLGRDDFRRLRVWLRWCAKVGGGSVTEEESAVSP